LPGGVCTIQPPNERLALSLLLVATLVSRLLSQSMEEIETHTLAEVRKHDPWLQLTWDDFVNLCSSVETKIL
jgi:hypothetical protein